MERLLIAPFTTACYTVTVLQRTVGRGLLFVVCLAFQCSSQVVGTISTIAGNTPPDGSPSRGFSGDDGPATSATLGLANVQNECDPARFEQMSGISVDQSGNVYVADSNNHRIRRIAPSGTISTVAGSGSPPPSARCVPTGGAAGAGEGGPARSARLYGPADVTFALNGDMIIVDQINNRIRRVDSTGTITTIVGSNLHQFFSPGTPSTVSGIDWPASAAYDSQGNLYFSELHSHRIGRIAPGNTLSTIAGNGFPGIAGDGGPAGSSQLSNPSGTLSTQPAICISPIREITASDASLHPES
jgi:hypothetical protein